MTVSWPLPVAKALDEVVRAAEYVSTHSERVPDTPYERIHVRDLTWLRRELRRLKTAMRPGVPEAEHAP